MPWKVPLADVDFGVAEHEAVRRVLDAGWITMGPETARFEHEFAEYIGVKHAVAVSSGTAALHLALLALGIQPGDEVILPSLTFVATANAALHAGGIPVFADIAGASDWNISPERIEEKITTATKAIVAVHYAGFPCALRAIRDIAEKHGLALVEDAAHAPGARYMGRQLGTWGDAGCFSFFSNKNLTTAEGGMVTTNDSSIAERVKLLRSHGMSSLTWDRHQGRSFSYDVIRTGFNYRIDEIRAALGRAQLSKLEENNRKRRSMTALLRRLLAPVPGVEFPFEDSMLSLSSCHIFPVLLPRAKLRPGFMENMRRAGIQTSIHYPPIHRFTAYADRYRGAARDLSFTEDVAAREVTLPLFPSMTPAQAREIASATAAWAERIPSSSDRDKIDMDAAISIRSAPRTTQTPKEGRRAKTEHKLPVWPSR